MYYFMVQSIIAGNPSCPQSNTDLEQLEHDGQDRFDE